MELVKTIAGIAKFISTSDVHVSLETVNLKWKGNSFTGQVKVMLHTGTPFLNSAPLCPSREFILDIEGEAVTAINSFNLNLFRMRGERKIEPAFVKQRVHVKDSANFLADELVLLIDFYKEENHPKITNRRSESEYAKTLVEEWLLAERNEHSFSTVKERYNAAK